MPELPEVETVRRGIEEALTGRSVSAVSVTGRRSVRRQTSAEFALALEGRTLCAARRRGKYLLLDLDDEAVLVAHLRAGRPKLLPQVEAGAPLAPHTHVVLTLDDATELRFIDPRTFGELFIAEELDVRRAPIELSNIGRDPLVDGIDVALIAHRLAHRRVALKAGVPPRSARACGDRQHLR